MNKGKVLLICLAGLFAAACAKDNVDQPAVSAPEVAIAKKFVNTSSDAVAGKLLVYVDKEYVSQLEAANGSICTGVSEIDAIAEQIGATGINQLFNMKVNADLKRELGMDRWFSIQFSEDVNVDDAAKALAASNIVRRVEFSKICKGPNVGEPSVVDANAIATRAGEFPVNDPRFAQQWPLLNEGNRCAPANGSSYTYADFETEGFVSPYAVKGADINVVPAWNITKGNRSVIVAIVDQGVDYEHEDLVANMWVNEAEKNGQPGVDDDNNGYVDDIHGYNFADNPVKVDADKVNPICTDRGRDNYDHAGHGTHVAGTVAAVSNNGVGIAGVAGGDGTGTTGARIMVCQILGGEYNTADFDAAARAMEYAADMGAVIASNSWGHDPGMLTSDNAYKMSMSARYVAFNYFMSKQNHPAVNGGIIIFAAGNESSPMAGYPGAYNEYISVTALGPDGLPALYTNYGPGCNIAAPGGEVFVNQYGHVKDTGSILSTLPNNQYGFYQGTSMATPHVSGVAALALSYAEDIGKTYTTEQFKEMLLTSVYDINADCAKYAKYATNGDVVSLQPYYRQMGTGAIDAYRALSSVRGMICVPALAGKETVVRISDLVADGQTTFKVLEDIIIPDDVRARLGIKDETIFGDDLIFTCANTGTGVIKLVMVGGGDQLGGGNSMGGMRLEKEIAIIVRGNYDIDPDGNFTGAQGWL